MEIRRIGIQKSGNLAEGSRQLLRNAGLVFAGLENGLIVPCLTIPLAVCYERIKYIPPFVEAGIFDLGIVGRDQLEEEPRNVAILGSLDFGQCAICVMGPPEIDFSPDLLAGRRIATSKPEIVQKYLRKMGIEGTEIIAKDGNTESMITLDLADFVADIVDTGETARSCGLIPYRKTGTIFESEAILIANSESLEKPSITSLIRNIEETRRIK